MELLISLFKKLIESQEQQLEQAEKTTVVSEQDEILEVKLFALIILF